MSQACNVCPRKCGVPRSEQVGFCGVGEEIRVARAALHPWEEPCISGKGGSGTIFFCGCNLRCVFCQNREISHGENRGKAVDANALANMMLRLRDKGADNINLVTPTHYTEQLLPVLERVRPLLNIPIVYNCGGYESVETLRRLNGLVDVYLPDAKYYSSDLSARYSAAPDYFEVLLSALREMLRQTEKPQLDENGMLVRGVLVRHMVLPACRKDSAALLHALFESFGNDAFLLSLMSQYTPAFAAGSADKNLHRRVTTFEYNAVCAVADALGFEGFTQARTSAEQSYTPNFREEVF